MAIRYIQNYDQLAKTEERKIVLQLIDAAIAAIQPGEVMETHFTLQDKTLQIRDTEIDLNKFQRVFLVGFGKGSAGISGVIEKKLGDVLTEGYVIDTKPQEFTKIQFTLGSHPLPSAENLAFTNTMLEKISNLKETDLVIFVTCGGGSAMLESPHTLRLDQLINLNKALLHAGANIHDMNVIRKHVSKIKGGGLAEHLYPATVVNLVFSDVPGDDLSVIASGPLIKDPSTVDQAWDLFLHYKLNETITMEQRDFQETPKDDKYFEKVTNIMMVSNMTALKEMETKAKELGKNVTIYSNSFQSDADVAGKTLIDATQPNSILLAGGETTVLVKGKGGEGGRNQELVIASLPYLDEKTTIASFDSDGVDNSPIAGAIADHLTIQTAKEKQLDPQTYVQNHDSSPFLKSVGDAILTDRLSSNVSDLMIVLKKN